MTENRLALCVGINDYPGTGSDLAGCVNDADAWSSELELRGFTVRQLLDGEATRDALVAAVTELVAQLGRGDVGVITYSGHGTWVPDGDGDETDGRDEALCPHDVVTAGPLTDDDLGAVMESRTYGSRLVLVADSCHSGTVSRLAPPLGSGDVTGVGHRVRFLPPAVALTGEPVTDEAALILGRAAGTPVRRRRTTGLLLAGCADTEYSYDGFGTVAMGAFSYVALDALRRLPDDATYAEWLAAVRLRLPAVDVPQTPQLHGTRTQRSWSLLRGTGR